SAALNVAFTPTIRGPVVGTVLLTTCAGCPAAASLLLTGTGALEGMTLTPPKLEFGDHLPGTNTCRDGHVGIAGGAPITVASVQPVARYQRGAFELHLGALLDGTLPLVPHAVRAMTVCFTPSQLGVSYSGRVDITTTNNVVTSFTVE